MIFMNNKSGIGTFSVSEKPVEQLFTDTTNT